MPWLMKAEPDSRIVKGKDVKFSVDDFERLGLAMGWSFEARNIMRDRMKLGDKVLFYHSNCKTPGVYAIAEVAKQGYPDHTAWDEKHPYYDEKRSDKDNPAWYMVDVRFIERLDHPVYLSFIKLLASDPKLPEEAKYIGEEGFEAIRGMQLVNRGRLSVQPVEQAAFDAIQLLGYRGGWEDLISLKSKKEMIKIEGGLAQAEKPRKSRGPSKREEEADTKPELPLVDRLEKRKDEETDVTLRRSLRRRKI